MSKLIDALCYLHKMGNSHLSLAVLSLILRIEDIVHRDLKLENILLRNSPRSKTDQFDIRVGLLVALWKRKTFLSLAGHRLWLEFEKKHHFNRFPLQRLLRHTTVSDFLAP